MSETIITLDLVGCARCHSDGHLQLVFRALTYPVVEEDGTELTHWAPCPNNGEPILMGTVPIRKPS